MASSLDTMPNEVIESIIQALQDNKKDISNLRLSCKLLGALGARYLVEEVCYVYYGYFDLWNRGLIY